ncbi:MAG: hypothetical protein IJF19_03830 [Clostridia bacterium]|nr:hypothetical protein [Clostridia bacterium]
MYIFKSKKENYYNPEIGRYTSYAIEVYSTLSSEPVFRICDAFPNLEKAKSFVAFCNKYQPEPVHLTEICIEFIG